MGEAARRRRAKALDTDPGQPADRGPWWHGTDATFSAWTVPPPPNPGNGPLVVAHKALFFTRDKSFAQCAGARMCSTYLVPHARVLVPGAGGGGSRRLRLALLEHRAARLCWWLRSDEEWCASWRNGTALRFAADEYTTSALLAPVVASLQRAMPEAPPDFVTDLAVHNLTRGWIEEVTHHAAAIGFDALQGRELDSASGPGASRYASGDPVLTATAQRRRRIISLA